MENKMHLQKLNDVINNKYYN